MQILMPLAFLVLFPVFWCFISIFLSRTGGWDVLATEYATDLGPPASVSTFQTGRVGFVNYGSCLRIATNDVGLHLSVLLPFRVGHPSLLVPWDDIRINSTAEGFFRSTAHISICGIDVRIPAKFIDHRSPDRDG